LFLVVALVAAVLVALGSGLKPAHAAISFTVDTFNDEPLDTPGDTNCVSAATPSHCSLRAALQAADNRGAGVTTINVPSGTYTLSPALGALQVGAVPGETVNIAGSAATVQQSSLCAESALINCMVFFLDPGAIGGINASISGLTIDGGHTANAGGGGGILGGSLSVTPDITAISDATFTDNSATGGPAGGGGGISYAHGTLTIRNSTFVGNQAIGGSGGGIDMVDQTGLGGSLAVTNSSFSRNTSSAPLNGGGGAIHLQGAGSTYLVTGTLFDGNSASSATTPGGGGAILKDSGALTVQGSAFIGNSTSGAGGAIDSSSDNSDLGTEAVPGLNRFAGNTAAAGDGGGLFRNVGNTGLVSAENNWWGTNTPNASDSAANVPLTNWIVLSLSASPTFIGRGGSTTLTADLSHNNAGVAPFLLPIAVSPIAVAWAPPATLGTLSGQTNFLGANGQATATYTADDVFGTGTASVTVDGQTVSVDITILSPPTIAKVFGGATVPLTEDTSLTFHLTNPNSVSALSEVGFTDNLPIGLVVATPNGLTGSCGGAVTAVAGSTSISLSGGTIAARGNCSFTVMVTGTAAGTKINTTGVVTSFEAGSDGTASASIDVVAPPSIAKSFSPNSINLNATTSLIFTITNPGSNAVALNGVGFTDHLPTGLTVASVGTPVCGGTLTTVAATGMISLSGATLAPGVNCTFAVTVTGAASGTFVNTTGFVTSTNGGSGNQSTDVLVVIGPPQIVKSFNKTSVVLGGSATLTFTIDNPNASSTLTGIGFTDGLPAGLVVATPNGLVGSCGGGIITAADGSSTISLSGATLISGDSCTFSVNVTGNTAGVKDNSVLVTSTEGGRGNTSTASITVVAPPSIAKAFGAASIPLNGSSTLTFTISNPNPGAALTGVGFTDSLPAGLVVQNSPAGACGGVVAAAAGSGTISLSGASIAAGGTCSFAVDVIGTTAGVKNNTTSSVTSNEGGTGAPASATLDVVTPPSIAKSFDPGNIALNATTSLSFLITNPNATDALTGVTFIDTLPTGLTVANSSAPGTCVGTLTTTAPTTISLSGASIAAGSSCSFAVTVAGAASGSYTNTTGPISSTNGGSGNTASANLVVASAPTIAKSFSAVSVPLNGSATLTFTINNPNTTLALTGVAFTDSLPADLVVATPNGLTGSCDAGTITAAEGSSSISLSGATVTSAASCSFSVKVTGTSAGVKINSVRVTSTEGGDGNTSNASITVVAPPTISKSFGAASIPLNGSTSLTFTITNPNATLALNGVGFSDSLPAGLVVQNSLAGACGGVVTAPAGSGTISLSGASIAAGGTCSFAVDVSGTTAGVKNNTTGQVTSTEGGTGATASASLVVVAPPSIAKAFSPPNIAINATTALTFTITNPNSTVVLTGVAFTDTLPTGLTVVNGSSSACGGGTLTTTAPTTIALSGGSVAAGSTCTFTVNVVGTTSGSYTNVTGAVTSTNGGTGNSASANLEVASPPTIVKSFGMATVPLNGSTSLTFTINNLNTSVALTGVGFTDGLPAGLVVATPNGLSGSCGTGTITAVSGGSTVSLGGGTIAPSSSCSFSVNVTGTSAGVKDNSVTVTSTEGRVGNTSTASITVVAPPTISKSFGAASIPLHGSTSLTFTIGNPNLSTTVTGIGFTDTLPGGLVVSSPNGLLGSCGGGIITAVAGSSSVSLSGAALAPGASCTFSVDVTGTTAGNKQNTTGPVASNEGGPGGTASASILVVAPPSITKSFGAKRIKVHRTTSLTFTITNPNAVSLNGVGFTDVLPPGLLVAAPNGLIGSCGGGTIVATAGTATISLTGATLAPNTSCTFSVRISGTRKGSYTNVTGAVNSTNGGVGNIASAHIRVIKGENDDEEEGGEQQDDNAWSERDTPDGRS
jgi:CSLREA domain-containing protein/uncharacterized repeat protein (TIGR01451 family)